MPAPGLRGRRRSGSARCSPSRRIRWSGSPGRRAGSSTGWSTPTGSASAGTSTAISAEPARHRGAGPIWADETFAELARVVRTSARAGRRPVGHRRDGRRARPRRRRSGRGAGCSATTAPWPGGRPRRRGSAGAWTRGCSRHPGGADRLRPALGDDRSICWAGARPPAAALAEVIARAVERRRRPGDHAADRRAHHHRDRPGAPACAGAGCPAGWSWPPSRTTTTPAGSTSPTAPCCRHRPAPDRTRARCADLRATRLRLPLDRPSADDSAPMTARPPNPGHRRLHLHDHLPADFADRSLRADVLVGLTAANKWLPPKWFYDKVGSELFEDITRLPEYYPTRTERAILTRHAAEIVALAGTRHPGRTRLRILGEDPAAAGRAHSHGAVPSGRRRVRRAGRQRGRAALGLRRLVARYPRPADRRGAAPTSPTSSTCCRPGRAGRWRSSAAPSATSTRPNGPRSSATCGAGLRARRPLPARRRPGQVPERPGAGLRRRGRGHRGVQPQRARRAEPAARRRLRPRRLRARRRLGREHEWIEMRLRATRDQPVRHRRPRPAR